MQWWWPLERFNRALQKRSVMRRCLLSIALAKILRFQDQPCSATELYSQADLTVADFYKQLAFEVSEGFIRDLGETLEAAS